MRTGSSEVVVVDASVAVKWLIDEEFSREAIALGQQWADAGIRIAAPHLMPFEVSNAMHKRVLEESLTVEGAIELMNRLASRRIELFELRGFQTSALQLASRFNQRAVYDSHYLALALALDCEFWTADERFYRAASPTIRTIRLITEAASPSQ